MVFVLLLLASQVDSLSLEQAIDIALAQSPAYYESKYSYEKSRILYYQTLANVLPTVSAVATYTTSEVQNTTSDAYGWSLSLNQPIFDLDIISSIFVNNRQLRGSRIQHQSNIADLMLRVKTAYYNLISAYGLLRSSEITIQRAEENLKLIETKFELGAASRLEKLQAEVFYLSALQDRARARTSQITAQEELRAVLATGHDIFPVDSLVPPGQVQFPTLDSLAVLLERANYAVRIAREARNAAQFNLVAAYLSFLPRVTFFYGYSYSADSFVFDFQRYKDDAVKNYGISIQLPIFEIKTIVFNILSAKKELQQQESSQLRYVLESQKSLNTAYYSLREAYERLEFVSKSLDAATEATAIAREQYALGVVSFLDLLTVEKDLYEARVTYTSSLSEFYIQRAQLSYLLGGVTFAREGP
jgi:outer membrane protein TolC